MINQHLTNDAEDQEGFLIFAHGVYKGLFHSAESMKGMAVLLCYSVLTRLTPRLTFVFWLRNRWWKGERVYIIEDIELWYWRKGYYMFVRVRGVLLLL